MRVVEAPEKYEIKENDICCFLAGGITGRPDWQKEVIKLLQEKNPENLVIFNPRRKDFDFTDPFASRKQIEWEFYYLNRMDIFSMYFCKDTIQPICLYELGRYMEVMKNRFPDSYIDRIIISIEPVYARMYDVIDQANLALGYDESTNQHIWYHTTSYKLHAEEIMRAYERILR